MYLTTQQQKSALKAIGAVNVLVRDHLLTSGRANIPVAVSECRDIINGSPGAGI